MRRFEVRGNHPATATWGTSGLMEFTAVRNAAAELRRTGHQDLEVIDHLTGKSTPLEDFLAADPSAL